MEVLTNLGMNNYDASNYEAVPTFEEALKLKGFETFQEKQKTRTIEGNEITKKKNIDRIMKREIQ